MGKMGLTEDAVVIVTGCVSYDYSLHPSDTCFKEDISNPLSLSVKRV